ncbi:MAG: hypothetical protein MK066_09015, partial [Crocinitomicaceae bacterium]|nr:hypothetical protein [Crocinitomicaceae bacterium]
MKNKALIYVLIPIVGLIWYKVFFRIKSNVTGTDFAVVKPNQVRKTFQAVQRDTFDLKFDYRDPFGDVKRRKNIPLTATNPVVTPIVNRRPKPMVEWPSILYKGRVKQTGKNEQHALIVI